MKPILSILFVFLLSPVFAQLNKDTCKACLPDSLKQILNSNAEEKELTKKGQITKSMRKAMDTIFHGIYSFSYGWRCSGDRPCHILNIILEKGGYLFVYYERNGRGSSFHLAIFNLSTLKLVHHSYVNPFANSIAELKELSKKDAFMPDGNYW